MSILSFIAASRRRDAAFVGVNLLLRLRASSQIWQDSGRTSAAVADNDPVKSWWDPINAKGVLQATSAKWPLKQTDLSRPVVVADGTDDEMSLSLAITQYTAFIVARSTASALDDKALFAVKNGRTVVAAGFRLGYPAVLDLGVAWSPLNVLSSDSTLPRVYTLEQKASVVNLYVNGALAATLSRTAFASATIHLGSGSGGRYAPAKFSELAITSDSLTQTARRAVERRLCESYGITAGNGIMRIICDGNSLTQGNALANPATMSYPAKLQGLLPGWEIVNEGLGGTTMAVMRAEGVGHVDARYEARLSRCIIIEWGEPSNSFASEDISAATAITQMLAYFADRMANNPGAEIWVITPIPRAQAGIPADTNTRIAACVAEILNPANLGVYWHKVIDLSGDSRFQDPNNTTYFLGDKTHPTEALNVILAGIIAPQV